MAEAGWNMFSTVLQLMFYYFQIMIIVTLSKKQSMVILLQIAKSVVSIEPSTRI